jgi:uncharacterized linocin/CFP29 family protein
MSTGPSGGPDLQRLDPSPQVFDPVPVLPYHPKLGLVPEAGPICGLLFCTLQSVVAEVAEAALVARRTLDVEYTEDFVPCAGPTLAAKSMEGALQPYTVMPGETGALATREFTVDAATLQAAERAPRRADLTTLVEATRELVAWEDREVLGTLATKATGIEMRPTLGHTVGAALATLRSRGYAGPVTVLVAVTDPPSERAEGEYAPPSALSDSPSLVLFTPAAGKTWSVLAMEACGHNVRLVVGQNYRLRWLRQDGVTHTFAITVSFQLMVADANALVKA